jgi:septum formation protein
LEGDKIMTSEHLTQTIEKKKSPQLAPKLILASGSPRRKELLEGAGFALIVHASGAPEVPMPNENPLDYCVRNASLKGEWVALKYQNNEVILSADTIVIHPSLGLLEKPDSFEHAKNMLRALSANTHTVSTGVSLWQNGKLLESFRVESKVTFDTLNDDLIAAYVATGEPMDKAGSYGIQGRAARFVKKVEGSYTNVMGLPLAETAKNLEKYGVFSH